VGEARKGEDDPRVRRRLGREGRREKAHSLLGTVGLPVEPALAPASWDSDSFRRPLGLSDGAGNVDAGKVGVELASARASLRRAFLLLGALALGLLAFVGLGGAAALARTLRTHRVAYAYVLPAMVGMLVLVFFPFLYGIVISFTDSTIYNTNAPLSEIFVGVKNYVSILSDFKIAQHVADGGLSSTTRTTDALITVIGRSQRDARSRPPYPRADPEHWGLAMKPAYRVLLIFRGRCRTTSRRSSGRGCSTSSSAW
jgi:hypothetical protein